MVTVGPKFPESPNTGTHISSGTVPGGKRLTNKLVLSSGDPGYVDIHPSLRDGCTATEDHCRVRWSTDGQRKGGPVNTPGRVLSP